MGGTVTRPNYNFVDATFHFFKVFGQRPLNVLWLMLWQILAYTALAAFMIWAFLPMWIMMFEAARYGSEPETGQVFAALGSGIGGISLGMLLGLILILMVQGAWLRLLARDEMAAVIPFRFGFDELRLLGINTLFWLVAMIAYFILAIIFTLLNAGLITADLSAGPLIIGLVNTVLVIGVLVGGIIIMLGFASTPALAIRQKGFRFLSGFAASSKIKGMMFLSYVVIAFVSLAILVVAGIFQQVVALLGLAEFIAMMPDFEAAKTNQQILELLGELFSRPVVIIALFIAVLVQIIAQIFYEGLWHGVGAYVAIRHDGGFDQEGPAEVVTPVESVGSAPSEG